MGAATNEYVTHESGLAAALERWLRPGVGFAHPRDVLKDPFLDHSEKRAVLSSWASDASAVENEPTLRWLLGTPEPVALRDVQDALAKLDRRCAADLVESLSSQAAPRWRSAPTRRSRRAPLWRSPI